MLFVHRLHSASRVCVPIGTSELAPHLTFGRNLCDIGTLESPSCAVADVQDLNLLTLFQHAVYRAINMWFVAVEQMSELLTLGRHRAPVRLFFQGEDRPFEPAIPLGCVRILGVDLRVQEGKIALGTSGEIN